MGKSRQLGASFGHSMLILALVVIAFFMKTANFSVDHKHNAKHTKSGAMAPNWAENPRT